MTLESSIGPTLDATGHQFVSRELPPTLRLVLSNEVSNLSQGILKNWVSQRIITSYGEAIQKATEM
jgi:hypothetical protein